MTGRRCDQSPRRTDRPKRLDSPCGDGHGFGETFFPAVAYPSKKRLRPSGPSGPSPAAPPNEDTTERTWWEASAVAAWLRAGSARLGLAPADGQDAWAAAF